MTHEHTVTVRLSDNAERVLNSRAGNEPHAVSRFVESVLERELSSERPSFDALAASFRDVYAASGTTESQLAQLIDEARREVYANKTGNDR